MQLQLTIVLINHMFLYYSLRNRRGRFPGAGGRSAAAGALESICRAVRKTWVQMGQKQGRTG
jgi:hypothetical protein